MAIRDLMTTGKWKGRVATFRKDRFIVGVRPQVALDEVEKTIRQAIERRSGATIITRPPNRRWALVGVPPGADIPELAEHVAMQPGIRYAEPDFLIRGNSPTYNDPLAGQQDWIPIVLMPGAWNVTQGGKRVLLAVLDSGICIRSGVLGHEDLSGPRFIIAHGTVSHDYTDSASTLPHDEHGHGTHVTGILAAITNNGKGVVAADWLTPVYVARVLDENNNGCNGAVKLAMEDLADYAPPDRRVVVNMSFGCTEAAEIVSLKEMCEDSNNGQFMLCCAPDFFQPYSVDYIADYPSRFAAIFPHVISVGASGDRSAPGEVRIPFEVQEPKDSKEVTVVAPGINVFSARYNPTTHVTDYGTDSGTSMAAPIVTGVISLAWNVAPRIPRWIIKWLLRLTGTALVRNGRTYRRVNARGMVWSAWFLRWMWFPWT